MKKLLLFLTVLLISFLSVAQNPVLFENNWYLQSFTFDSVNYNVPVDDPLYSQQIIFDETSDGYYISTFITSETFSASPTFDNNTFTTQIPTITLFGCDDYCELEQAYLYDFFFREAEPYTFNYTIAHVDDGNGGVIELDVIDQEGNIATYYDTRLSIPEHNKLDVSIYPNPAIETLFITSGNNTIQEVSIFSVNGQLVLSEKGNINQLSVSALSNGLYFIEIVSENRTAIEKFIKK